MKAVLEKSHIGIAGYRADGFFNLGIDELRNFRETGVLLDRYELEDMFSRDITNEELSEEKQRIHALFNCSNITNQQVEKVAALCKKTEKFLNDNKLDALAIRCWPEFAATYGIAPCAMMSILQADERILACEGDLEGGMTMLASRAAGAETPFLADLSQVNFEENYALMWHCGVAPVNLWDGKSVCSLDTYFAGGKGVTAGFVLKSGTINVIRLDSAHGKTRVFLGKGEAGSMEKQLTGTYAKATYTCSVCKLLDTVMSTGITHHLVVVYGDYLKPFRLFAKMMKWEIIEV